MKHSLALLLAFGFVTGANAAIIYDNTNVSQNNFQPISQATYLEGGDDATFAGSQRAVDWAKIGIFNNGSSSETGDLTLTLYALDGGFQGPHPLPGTALASTTLSSLTLAPGDAGLLQFDFADVVVPDSIGWTITVGGNFNTNDIGTEFYSTPTTGSTVFGYFEKGRFSGAWGMYYNPGNGQDYGDFEAQFDAQPVPEPETLVVLALGLTALHRRKMRLRLTGSKP